MTEDPSNPVPLGYAAPERPRRNRIVAILFAMSFLHFVALCVLGSVSQKGPAADWVLYVMALPPDLCVKLGLLELVSDSNGLLIVLTLLNSLLYGAGLTATYLMIWRVLKR